MDPKAKKLSILLWGIYWFLILGIYFIVSFIFKNFLMYIPIPFFGFFYFCLWKLLYFPFRTIRHKLVQQWLRIVISIISLTVTTLFYMRIIENGSRYNEKYIEALDYSIFSHNSQVTYNYTNGVYTIQATAGEFKILQLTDIHLGGGITTISTDRKALFTCYELIRETQPDLILVTGDIVYPIPLQSFSKNNLKPIYQFSVFMNHIGIPWAMVYGNHDTEAVASYDNKAFEGLFESLKNEPDCPMLYSSLQPAIYGRYNQYLQIENTDGTLNRLIFLMDSNDYLKGPYKVKEYDSVHEDQITWYTQTIADVSAVQGKRVPSFVFMHIPFQEFADAKQELDRNGKDTIYLFGENKEDVCHPQNNRGFFDAILKSQSTEAVFVGHDHVNNIGIKYKGVDLVYSKSIDYLAYPGIQKMTDQRGATLITLMPDATYTIEQIDYLEK